MQTISKLLEQSYLQSNERRFLERLTHNNMVFFFHYVIVMEYFNQQEVPFLDVVII